MSPWLIALILSTLAVIAATVHLVLRGLDLYRAFRDSGGALGNEVFRVSEAAELTSAKAERLAQDSDQMADAAARLARSRAQLNVLIQAIRDVQDSVGRVIAIVPRK